MVVKMTDFKTDALFLVVAIVSIGRVSVSTIVSIADYWGNISSRVSIAMTVSSVAIILSRCISKDGSQENESELFK